jgi:hypothetical protein
VAKGASNSMLLFCMALQTAGSAQRLLVDVELIGDFGLGDVRHTSFRSDIDKLVRQIRQVDFW